jgi:carboxymethylenebutenolidase
MAQALMPRYARAQTISFTDPRIKAQYVNYPSPGGSSGNMRGYLVQPAGAGPFPAVLVIHENRGLNPYVEDVARRAAVEGFLALAPDGLAPVGGYPGNDDDGRNLQSSLDPAKLRTDMLNSARFLKAHKSSNGKLGVTGFCWGGGATNFLATALGPDMQAGVPHEMHKYPGTQHGFHNNSTPRYNEAAAKLAWERTVAHFRKYLA